jgi:hypothetical protein
MTALVTDVESEEQKPHEESIAGRLLLLIFILLPFVLLGMGYYLVTIPENTMMAGIKQTVWFGVGQSVVASALVSFVMLFGAWADRLMRSAESKMVVSSLAEYRRAVDILKQTGLRRIHNDRYIRPVYQRYQREVVDRLDLLGMSLKHFQQDVGAELAGWVHERENLHIRIVLLNPNSPYCDIRDGEEGGPVGEISEWGLRLTEIVLQAGHPRIKVRWHNTLPTVNMYRLDDVMFIGPYLIGRLSRLTTTLEVDVKGLFAEQYLQHFENLWSPPRTREGWSQVPTLLDVKDARDRLAQRRGKGLIQ